MRNSGVGDEARQRRRADDRIIEEARPRRAGPWTRPAGASRDKYARWVGEIPLRVHCLPTHAVVHRARAAPVSDSMSCMTSAVRAGQRRIQRCDSFSSDV